MDFDDNDDGQRDTLDLRVMEQISISAGVVLDPTEASSELMDLGYITAPQEVRYIDESGLLPGVHEVVDDSYFTPRDD